MTEEIVIIGGRGNGTVIASAIEDCAQNGQDISVVGFLNDHEKQVNGYPVLGSVQSSDWRSLSTNFKFIFSLSNIKMARDRHRILEEMEIPINRFSTIVHPTAVVASNAQLGRGVAIMPHVVVGPNVIIGNHSLLYAQSFVGHDTVLDEMVFVANNASIGGRIKIGTGAHIGSNSSTVERLNIGRFSIVGLGSVVLQDVKENNTVVGNPARVL